MTWAGMLARCNNPKAANFERYGGRGITVCAEWASFDRFLADMGEKPNGMSIERNDNDGPYCKENCSWKAAADQQRNRRNNRMIEYQGERLCLSDWCLKLGIDNGTLRYRLKNWPIDRALTSRIQ